MKFNFKTIVVFAAVLLFGLSCKDIIEEDLEKERVQLTNPKDNRITTFSTQTFMWNELEGADYYHLQIVNESFQNLNYFVLDSNIVSTSFVFNLTPGNYQWRVRAQNSVSASPYSTRTIQIDSSSDLTGQQVLLNSPVNSVFLNDTSLGFSWSELYNADEYIFELRQNDFLGALLYTDTLLATDLQSGFYKFEEGNYGWGVKAINSISSTTFNSRTFTIDLTPPNAPGIIGADSTQKNPFTIQWSRNSSDVIHDSVFIYSDIFLTNLVRSKQANETYTDSLNFGVYYWRVKSIDKANNPSSFSNRARLEITP